MQEFDEVVLSEPKRRDYAGPLPLGDGSQDPRQGSQEEHPGPTVKGRAADRFLQAVDWLVDNGCCTEAKWIEMDKMGYRSFMSTSQGVLQVKNALNLARRELVAGNKLLESIVKGADPWVPGVVNAVARLFHINGYDPEQAAWYLANWAKGGHQKRRALWLFGPANTGKTLLAGAFAKLAPCFGCVNWNNENFPFSDCASQSLIWWEEGKMSEKFVEAAKAILGGSEIRIDIKGKPSEQFIPAPVVITSNGDMCTVYSGNVISTAHAGPLKSRMLKVTFSHVLPGGPNADLPLGAAGPPQLHGLRAEAPERKRNSTRNRSIGRCSGSCALPSFDHSTEDRKVRPSAHQGGEGHLGLGGGVVPRPPAEYANAHAPRASKDTSPHRVLRL